MKDLQKINEEAKEALKSIRLNTRLSADYDMYKLGTSIEAELKKQVQKKEDGRAVNKRRRQLRERLTVLMDRFLKPFENRYINAYTEWSMTPIKLMVEVLPSCTILDGFKGQLNDTTHKQLKERFPRVVLSSPNTRRGETEDSVISNHDISNIFYKVNKARSKMKIESLTRFDFMQEASQGYAIKFDNLINKMVDYEFSTGNLRVEKVSDAGNELAFLITNNERTIHARAIFINGSINAPHYRFITTERKS